VVVSLEIGSLTALPLRLISVSSPLSSSLGVPLLAATTGPAAAPFVAYSPARPFAGEEHPPGGLSDLILRKLGWTLHVKKVWHQEARQREKQH